ncbi:plasmid maintenance protein CcdB [Azospirillum sp. TSH100]|uniref:CcdB family protein n=1 Tax=Azospirillum sp. TSH100 TaxID=652764 RepID=UPI000D621B34|nr:CcdB family protein [Azospirillum sp. TSH100]PWC85195.1 plasmid maintenance protein CcdB [Azospirillum sp. TSH100]QCG88888.1 plasmid maintenance protein CcdB [Azospirillum sp. TSH100]
MARFDIHRRLDGPGYLLDLQADILRDLNTRFVAPLLPPEKAPRPAARLNPVFSVEGRPHVMVTQFAGAVTLSELGSQVGNLLAEDTAIIAALDMLIGA